LIFLKYFVICAPLALCGLNQIGKYALKCFKGIQVGAWNLRALIERLNPISFVYNFRDGTPEGIGSFLNVSATLRSVNDFEILTFWLRWITIGGWWYRRLGTGHLCYWPWKGCWHSVTNSSPL